MTDLALDEVARFKHKPLHRCFIEQVREAEEELEEHLHARCHPKH